jgi:hypothetical protein
MTLGSVVEEVTVTAVAATLQTASSEKSALVDGKQLNQIALRGRDLFGYLRLLPGVTELEIMRPREPACRAASTARRLTRRTSR